MKISRGRGHVNDVALDKFITLVAVKMGNIFALAGEEVIDPDDAMPLLEEQVGQVGAKEAGSAGNKDSHGRHLSPIQ
jgi:hypothetical protein